MQFVFCGLTCPRGVQVLERMVGSHGASPAASEHAVSATEGLQPHAVKPQCKCSMRDVGHSKRKVGSTARTYATTSQVHAQTAGRPNTFPFYSWQGLGDD